MYSRHDLLWLTAEGWAGVLALPGCPPELARWQRDGVPLVARRREPGMTPESVALGAPLPRGTDGNKRRFGCTVRIDDVAHSRRPLPLSEACHALPGTWRAMGERLAHALPSLRVYGSVAMQALTGEQYLRPDSDIDILFAPSSRAELEAGERTLMEAEASLPLDGEIVFASGQAVAWKEWAQCASKGERVLVKSHDGVRLERPAALVEALC
jgi:phosphoribosyl-dephospho-CoA transferase